MRLLCLGSLLLLTGCNRDTTAYPVSGTVEYAGQPVPSGTIYFDPDPAKQNTGPQGYALIINGKYDTRETGKGVRGGSYLVRIEGFDGKPAPSLPLGNRLFPN